MSQKKQKNILAGMLLGALVVTAYPAAAETKDAFKRPALTVEECAEKTGKTEAECEEMMEKFKNMTPPENGEGRKRMERKGGENSENANLPGGGKRLSREKEGTVTEAALERAKRTKIEREEQFNRMLERTEKIIAFLEEEDADVEELESNLTDLKNKINNVISAYDNYIAVLEQDIADNKTELSDESKEKRISLQTALKDLSNYYRQTLRANIQAQLDQLK